MTTSPLLESLRSMTNAERLEVIETASRLIREELVHEGLMRAREREDAAHHSGSVSYRVEEVSEWGVTG